MAANAAGAPNVARASPPVAASTPSAARTVWKAVCAIVGEEVPFDLEANLVDVGVDSLGMAELVVQLEEAYGVGVVEVDDVISSPILKDIASKLPGAPPANAVAPPNAARAAALATAHANVRRPAAKPAPTPTMKPPMAKPSARVAPSLRVRAGRL